MTNQILFAVVVIVILIFVINAKLFMLWYSTKISGTSIGLNTVFMMRLRKSPVEDIVKGFIVAKKAGLQVLPEELESAALAGNNLQNVVFGLIAARQANVQLSIKDACKKDLEGVNLVQHIKLNLKKP